MRYYSIEPEVAGGFGDQSVIDSSVHPPIISKLHYEFSGWLGDSIVESFPSFIVSEELAGRLRAEDIRGMKFGSVFVSKSPEYLDSNTDRVFPNWLWLKVVGGKDDDVYIDSSHTLVVSERVLHLFREIGLAHADVEEI